MADTQSVNEPAVPPLAPGYLANVRFDLLAGFLVFLIAMPLCLAIAKASGFPPIAGIWTAVVGGIVTTFISNSEMTIKGPAAGLIVIVAGAVTELGNHFGPTLDPLKEDPLLGYRLALGIGVAAGVTQIIFSLIRAGRLVDFFPLTPVHGMLASIGIIIIVKQLYEAVGAPPEPGAGPLMLLLQLPGKMVSLNPEIAAIGIVSLIIIFGLPWIHNQYLKMVPPQIIVLAVAIGMGLAFQLQDTHPYEFTLFSGADHPTIYEVGPKFLVAMPEVLKEPEKAFAFPDFRGLASLLGLKYLLLFSLIGSLESLLSAKAIDLLDPWQRKTNFDRDLLAIGVANTAVAAIGGLPMISEIVRSSANINNGARTRFADFFHGLFLLLFVLMLPGVIRMIPLAALAAMLVFTGFRLASPKEFVRTYKVGTEQFMIFVTTIVVTLATDLLIGICAGIALKILFHLWNGVPIRRLFLADIEVVPQGDTVVILIVKKAAVFSNWIGVRNVIYNEAEGRDQVVLDLSDTNLVDHSVMEKLHELEIAFSAAGKKLLVQGLERHVPLSAHPFAARKRKGQLQPNSSAPVAVQK